MRLGEINILVNAAGIFKAEPMLYIDEWDWRRQIEVNMTGVFFCMQLVGRVMANEGGGCMINLASAAGYQKSLPAGIGFVSGKSGMIGMTLQAARELARHHIRVNAIAAGNINEDDMPRLHHSIACFSESDGQKILPKWRCFYVRMRRILSPVK